MNVEPQDAERQIPDKGRTAGRQEHPSRQDPAVDDRVADVGQKRACKLRHEKKKTMDSKFIDLQKLQSTTISQLSKPDPSMKREGFLGAVGKAALQRKLLVTQPKRKVKAQNRS